MQSYKKKLTNMIWRSMGESIVFSFIIVGALLYAMSYFGLIAKVDAWSSEFFILIIVGLAVPIVAGGTYGFWSSNRIRRRLEPIMETMQLLEKGTFTRGTLNLGEDEIGRLGQQLERVTKKWEEQVNTLQRLSNHNAQLAEKARFSAVMEERQRLARELHDAVSQQLFAISMTATAVGRIMDRDFEKAKRQIFLIEEMSSVAQSEMRALLMHLRPVHLEGKRLSVALNDLLLELRAKVTMDIDWEADEDIILPKGIEDHLFRIVQEALSNALRHAKATKLELKLLQRIDGVRLMIRDNGVGFDLNESKKQSSYGLTTMRERVSEIGGSISVVAAPEQGTRIEIRVPIISEGVVDDGGLNHQSTVSG
ncbi:sensor histidine kinase [Paenibacillus sp. N1-5-1-14]|uniref:sensor histidine kinase n=1 Tax=Paenibacillus radicibacter TaxID=2972488 RepID=UPI002158BB07|nr:sensor histidine kinase [Paenibacillus radicibacter]MCR8645343.1 sensor histidine kinase [Paenibacillus radicibacter]